MERPGREIVAEQVVGIPVAVVVKAVELLARVLPQRRLSVVKIREGFWAISARAG
jgi:hypothetical protein